MLCLAVLLCGAGVTPAAEPPPAAAVASSNDLATRAGVEILKQGGNAFDAAVAVTAVLAVVEPYSAGLGGGGLWLLHRASDGKQVLLDGRERAPRLAHWHYFSTGNPSDNNGSGKAALSAAIPGIPAAIVHLARNYGRLPLTADLKPAQNYAKKGFYVSGAYLSAVSTRLADLLRDPGTAGIFLDHGLVPRSGYWLKQKELAQTLAALAEHGLAGFYQGEVAGQLVLGVNKHGGIWTAQDLLSYQVREREPLVYTFHDMRVIAAPPPSAGGVVLGQALGMLSHFDLDGMDSVARMHHVVECLRRSFRDSAAYLGDPDAVVAPLTRLLNADYLEGLALTIDSSHATPSEVLGDTPGLAQSGLQTTHFSIIDAEGNRVSGTLSGSAVFGAAYAPAGTGVLLNNSMMDFVMEPDGEDNGRANALRPEKRPLTSMTPAFLETADRVAVLGTPGGNRIISMMLLATLGFAGNGSAAALMAQPRYHHQYLPDVIEFEKNALTVVEQERLRAMGHRPVELPELYGDMQVVIWDRQSRTVDAASDPRGSGSAVVVPEAELRHLK